MLDWIASHRCRATVGKLSSAVPDLADQRHVAIKVVVVDRLRAALRFVVAQVDQDEQQLLGVVKQRLRERSSENCRSLAVLYFQTSATPPAW